MTHAATKLTVLCLELSIDALVIIQLTDHLICDIIYVHSHIIAANSQQIGKQWGMQRAK